MTAERVVMAMPDLHTPYESKPAWRAFLAGLGTVQPDELVVLGDFMDTKAPARWSKGRAAEYAGDLAWEIENAKARLAEVRDVYPEGRVSFITGNHENRINTYLHQWAPALVGVMPALPELLDFEGFGVDHVAGYNQTYKLGTDVIAIHGNKLSSTLNASGQSAFKERMRHGVSVVQGHTHRLGLGYDTQGSKTRFWLEAGCLCDIKKMEYLDYQGVANWQLGCGVLYFRGSKVFPTIHYIQGDRVPSLTG
jgi:predicted phosphodiesterase